MWVTSAAKVVVPGMSVRNMHMNARLLPRKKEETKLPVANNGGCHAITVTKLFAIKRLTQFEMTFGDTFHHLGEVSDRMPETAGVFA